MLHIDGYVFKQAETTQEFEQIHCLNYRTFVGEIPQHADPGTGKLVDKFHSKNAYLIAVRGSRVVAMVSVHDQPPFSVAERLSDPSILERSGNRPLEVRLLAVEPDKRRKAVVVGLLWSVYEYARNNSYTHLYISGVEDRLSMYEQLGFEPLGPAVPCGQARFVPMVVSIGRLADKCRRTVELWLKHVQRMKRDASLASTERGTSILSAAEKKKVLFSAPRGEKDWGEEGSAEPLCLLPGPVQVAAMVHDAFCRPPIYHRGAEFIALFEEVRRTLGLMVGGRNVALFNGSGTLANEVVAATLAAEHRNEGRGLLLVNGEFGQRLAQQAARFGLQPRILTWPWGQPWDLDEIDAALGDEPEGSWVWGVHQESSTGVLNDLPGLVCLARARRTRVCADCISSLGAVPLDLRDVYLASGASGKSLGAYAGAAIVFTNGRDLTTLDTRRIPSSLDLPAALATVGPRYTFPSPTLLALDTALAEYATPETAHARYKHYADLGSYVREQLRRVGLNPLADDRWASPVITTFAPPDNESPADFVARCRSWGFALGGQSGYLAERGLVQIATMGAARREMCAPLFEMLASQRSFTVATPGGLSETSRLQTDREPVPCTAHT